jgi:hypothetical protein
MAASSGREPQSIERGPAKVFGVFRPPALRQPPSGSPTPASWKVARSVLDALLHVCPHSG